MRYRAIVQSTVILVVLSYVLVPRLLEAQGSAPCANSDCLHVSRIHRQGHWFVAETANFQICCEDSEPAAEILARRAESLRKELRDKWLGDASSATWIPRCQILLYSSQRSYVAAVGRGSERTVGSSLVDIDKGLITKRRIDLLGHSTDYLSAALPHELTHVILKDRFDATALPRWADEGMAILADTDAKQERHFKDLQKAFTRRTTFHVAELLTMEDYPSPTRFGTFYGQSASLAKFLVLRKTPKQFTSFIELANTDGYDSALQHFYGISGPRELDRLWRQYVDSVRTPTLHGG
jgi:hypothetical protein